VYKIQLLLHSSTNRPSVNLPGNLYSIKQSHPLCWDVKECHIQDEWLCLILNTAKNLETRMRSVRSRMDFEEGSQGLFQYAIRYNHLEFFKMSTENVIFYNFWPLRDLNWVLLEYKSIEFYRRVILPGVSFSSSHGLFNDPLPFPRHNIIFRQVLHFCVLTICVLSSKP